MRFQSVSGFFKEGIINGLLRFHCSTLCGKPAGLELGIRFIHLAAHLVALQGGGLSHSGGVLYAALLESLSPVADGKGLVRQHLLIVFLLVLFYLYLVGFIYEGKGRIEFLAVLNLLNGLGLRLIPFPGGNLVLNFQLGFTPVTGDGKQLGQVFLFRCYLCRGCILDGFCRIPGILRFLTPGTGDALVNGAYLLEIGRISLHHIGIGTGFFLLRFLAGFRQGVAVTDNLIGFLCIIPGSFRYLGLQPSGFLQHSQAFSGSVFILFRGFCTQFRNIPFCFRVLDKGFPLALVQCILFLRYPQAFVGSIIILEDSGCEFAEPVHHGHKGLSHSLKHLCDGITDSLEGSKGTGEAISVFLTGLQSVNNLGEDVCQEAQDGYGRGFGKSLKAQSGGFKGPYHSGGTFTHLGEAVRKVVHGTDIVTHIAAKHSHGGIHPLQLVIHRIDAFREVGTFRGIGGGPPLLLQNIQFTDQLIIGEGFRLDKFIVIVKGDVCCRGRPRYV